jgi:hypothetical protein
MMADHEIEIIRNRDRFTAVCSCGRWKSASYLAREDAETKGEAHMVRGDQHLRALAQFSRGAAQLRTEWKWYVEQAENPLNSEAEREMWQQLADELEPRVKAPPTDEGQDALF